MCDYAALGHHRSGTDRDIATTEWFVDLMSDLGAHLTEEEHLALGRRFGTPSIYPVARVMGATEPTMTVIKHGPNSPNAADRWHTDVTWIATPPKAALLHMELAAEYGGDTLWASATRAYETLSPAVQEFFASLTVVHSNEGYLERVAEKAGERAEAITEAIRRDYGPVEHPLVRTHPETGQAGLAVRRGVRLSCGGREPG